jgi:hypothetical protein
LGLLYSTFYSSAPTLPSQTPPTPKTLLLRKGGVQCQLHVFLGAPQEVLSKTKFQTFPWSCGNITHHYHSLCEKIVRFISFLLLPSAPGPVVLPPRRRHDRPSRVPSASGCGLLPFSDGRASLPPSDGCAYLFPAQLSLPATTERPTVALPPSPAEVLRLGRLRQWQARFPSPVGAAASCLLVLLPCTMEQQVRCAQRMNPWWVQNSGEIESKSSRTSGAEAQT